MAEYENHRIEGQRHRIYGQQHQIFLQGIMSKPVLDSNEMNDLYDLAMRRCNCKLLHYPIQVCKRRIDAILIQKYAINKNLQFLPNHNQTVTGKFAPGYNN